MAEEWYGEQIEKLKIKETCLSTLTIIRERLKETPSLDANVVNLLLSSPEFYNCAEEYDEIVCDILSQCFKNLSFPGNQHLLQRGLTHKHERIKNVVLHAILTKVTECKEVAATDIVPLELLHHILLAVHEQSDVGLTANKILHVVLRHYLDEPDVGNGIREALKQGAIVKCRLYEIAVKYVNQHSDYLPKVTFILDHALSELDNDDVLVQVNILEALVTLAEFKLGIGYLEERQVCHILAKRIEEMDDSSLDRLLIPGVLKFFGKIAVYYPGKIIPRYPHVIRYLFACLNKVDPSMLIAAYDTLVYLTHTERGVYLLETNYGIETKGVFEQFSAQLSSLPMFCKTRALYALCRVFTMYKEVMEETSDIFLLWFVYLSRSATNIEFLVPLCCTPIVELSNATFSFIRALCSYRWGVQAVKNTGGFLELLLNRAASPDQGTKYIKYCIIGLLEKASDIFDIPTQIQLRRYINEGVFYEPVVMEVSVEQNQ